MGVNWQRLVLLCVQWCVHVVYGGQDLRRGIHDIRESARGCDRDVKLLRLLELCQGGKVDVFGGDRPVCVGTDLVAQDCGWVPIPFEPDVADGFY